MNHPKSMFQLSGVHYKLSSRRSPSGGSGFPGRGCSGALLEVVVCLLRAVVEESYGLRSF